MYNLIFLRYLVEVLTNEVDQGSIYVIRFLTYKDEHPQMTVGS